MYYRAPIGEEERGQFGSKDSFCSSEKFPAEATDNREVAPELGGAPLEGEPPTPTASCDSLLDRQGFLPMKSSSFSLASLESWHPTYSGNGTRKNRSMMAIEARMTAGTMKESPHCDSTHIPAIIEPVIYNKTRHKFKRISQKS